MSVTDTAQGAASSWIGRTREASDTVTEALVARFRATFGPHLFAAAAVPPGVFWCLAPDVVAAERLGADGHPARGVVMPPVPFERRMWAGGEVAFHGDLAPGERVTKRTTITDITQKEGRSGRLAFVTVTHDYHAGERLVISERQDVVYRDATGEGPSRTPPAADPPAPDALSRTVSTDPVLLFRYSALTFNGHRIHYDAPYAREEEGYDGLVVHGPLQATLILNLAAERLGRLPRVFGYRGKSPLIVGRPVTVEVWETSGGLAGRCVSADNVTTFTAAITP